MPITIYRGDGRQPQDIRDDRGFNAKLPLSTAAARAIIIRATINSAQNVFGLTGNRVSQIVKYLQEHHGLVGLDPLYQQIKKEREANSIHISTETTTGGGGMGGSYIYRIDCPTPLYEWGQGGSHHRTGIATPPRTVNSNANLTPHPTIRKFLLTDANVHDDPLASVQAANVIALYSPASTVQEIAFLTAIPYGWIPQYRQGQGAWNAMP